MVIKSLAHKGTSKEKEKEHDGRKVFTLRGQAGERGAGSARERRRTGGAGAGVAEDITDSKGTQNDGDGREGSAQSGDVAAQPRSNAGDATTLGAVAGGGSGETGDSFGASGAGVDSDAGRVQCTTGASAQGTGDGTGQEQERVGGSGQRGAKDSKVKLQVNLAAVGPKGLGLKRFEGFRPQQITMARMAKEMRRKFLVMNAPTGTGKSLGYTAAMMQYVLEEKDRALVVLKTKQLQDQYGRDFGEVSRDLRGKGNYPCVADLGQGFLWEEEKGVLMADKAPCKVGKETCPLMWNGCPYWGDLREAQRARIVSTNYHLWMAQALGKEGKEVEEGEEIDEKVGLLGQFGMIVMDEVHGAGDALCGYMSVDFDEWKVGRVSGERMPKGDGVQEWRQWAKLVGVDVEERLRKVGRSQLEERSRLGNMAKDLRKFGRWADEHWVMVRWQRGDRGQYRGVKWMPVWPGKFFGMISEGAKKVVLTSATISKKTVKLLGVEEGEMEYREFPAVFDKKRRPVYYSPVARLDSKGSEFTQRAELQKAIEFVARLAGKRQGKRGLVQAVSYARTQRVVEGLRALGIKVIGHESGGLREAVERFKRSEKGTVLVSPAASEGVDLPYEMCEWQVILKVPFADSRDPVMKKRAEEDSDYPFYLIAQEVLQMCGRIVRAKDDFGETFITDEHWGWVQKRVKGFMPMWFWESHRQVTGVPTLREI